MRSTKLAAGIVAGPLFITATLVQAFTRDGFDLSRHPISLLSLGDHGWIQIANFVVTGLLLVAYAAGLREAFPDRIWGPRLIGVQGAGLIIAGVFVTDAGAGFPAGAPEGRPDQISWHGLLHEAGFVVAYLSWTIACFTLRVAAGKWFCIAAIAVAAWPHPDSLSVRLVISTAIQFAFLASLQSSGGVVEDKSEGVTDSGADRAHAVPDR